MYFLNGDRIYIKPKKACDTTDEQLQNCLLQLQNVNSGKKVFKLNFFVDTVSKADYVQLKQNIEKKVAKLYPDNILQSVIAQPPLTCKVIVEVCYYDPLIWKPTFLTNENFGAVLFKSKDSEILIGSVQSYTYSSCKLNSESAFTNLIEIFTSTRFPLNSIVRQWNYLEDILGMDGQEQRYQEFNNVRSGVYGTTFEEKGYPAATGIGMNQGGIIIEFSAIKSHELITIPIDNPEQIAAHTYSEKVLVGEECVLKTTPKFERARYLELYGKKMIFISGTASIVGEKTVGVNDSIEQTEVTIKNIKQLYSSEVIDEISSKTLNPKYGHARIYIKNRKDFKAIKKTFKSHFGNLPVVYIIADICRTDLLVEIEGKVILV